MGRPVDEKAYKPTPKERPVDDEAYEPMPEGRPVADPKLVNRPVNEATYEPTPRERPVDNQTLMERPKTEPRPKERPVDPETVPLMYKAPPPSDLPEWSDSELMPLIIIENNSGVAIPRTTDGLLPVGSDISLPQSPGVNSLEDQGVLSAPMSPNQVRKGHSQDMPAEGSIFDVSPDVPGFPYAAARGRGTANRDHPALAVELRRFQQPVLRSTNCVCSVSKYLGDGYNDDCAHL